MDDIKRAYPYEPRWTVIVSGALLCGLAATVLAAMARGDNPGLIPGVLGLSPSVARTLFWVVCAANMGFGIMTALVVVHRLMLHQRIAFGPTALIVPRSRWSGRERRIAYGDITGLKKSNFCGHRSLVVTYAGGWAEITASLLPSRQAFEEVCGLLDGEVHAAQRVESGRPAAGGTS